MDDYPTTPRGWGGVLLAPWPPPSGQTLAEAHVTLWLGEPDEELGFDIDADGIGELVVLYDAQRSVSPPYTRLHLVLGSVLAAQTDPVTSFDAIASRMIDESWTNPYLVAPPLPTDEALWVGVFSQTSPFQTPQGNAWAHHVDLAPGTSTPTVAILPYLSHDKPWGVAPLGDARFAAYDNAERFDGTRVGLVTLFATDVASPVSPNLGVSAVLGTPANPLEGISALPDLDGDGERELVVVSDRWEVFLSTALEGAGPLPPDAGDASAPDVLRLVPDMNGDGLPELWSAYRVVETSEIPWDGTPIESLPASWDGALGDVGPVGTTSRSMDFAFLSIDGDDYIAIGIPWLLGASP